MLEEMKTASYAARAVQLKAEVIVSPTFQAIRAAKQATKAIPISSWSLLWTQSPLG